MENHIRITQYEVTIEGNRSSKANELSPRISTTRVKEADEEGAIMSYFHSIDPSSVALRRLLVFTPRCISAVPAIVIFFSLCSRYVRLTISTFSRMLFDGSTTSFHEEHIQ
jgi:hypothetical protein